MKEHMNVVLNFHKGDQESAKHLLNLLMEVAEGINTTYYIQYGDDEKTLSINETLSQFNKVKNCHFSNELPAITIPKSMIENDPNQQTFKGLHSNKSTQHKFKVLGWNLCLYKYINLLDDFLIIEPDCVILKHDWLKDIYTQWKNTSLPIFGHLKRGKIHGEYYPTHWAGCSVYNSKILKNLPLEKYFYERYDNPWWEYRNETGSETANNCFLGPKISGYDVSYDYFLFALFWKETTQSNNPYDWNVNEIESRDDIIFCDFQSKISHHEIYHQFRNKLPLLHGVKSDEIRKMMAQYFKGDIESQNHIKEKRKKDPLVSVVIPAYNCQQYIDEAIESVLTQTYKNLEIIVVNDGSTDNTKDLVTTYETKDPRLKLISKENGGQASAFNTAFKQVKGDIVSFLDSDDFWMPEKIEKVVRLFQKEKYVIVQHNHYVVDDNSNREDKVWPVAKFSGNLLERYFIENHVGFFSTASGISCKKEYLDKVLPIIPESEWKICADVPLVTPLPYFGDIYTIPYPLGYYRIHDSNNWMNSEQQKDQLNNFKKYIQYTNQYLERLGELRKIDFTKSHIYHNLLAKQIILHFQQNETGEGQELLKEYLLRDKTLFQAQIKALIHSIYQLETASPISIINKIFTHLPNDFNNIQRFKWATLYHLRKSRLLESLKNKNWLSFIQNGLSLSIHHPFQLGGDIIHFVKGKSKSLLESMR